MVMQQKMKNMYFHYSPPETHKGLPAVLPPGLLFSKSGRKRIA
jgi:hypothetical protein